MGRKIRYVRCKVLPGLFETEFYVSVSGSSAFVDHRNVRVPSPPGPDNEVEGEVLTYLIDEGDGRDEALVELAGEAVVGGLRTWVPKVMFAGA